MKIIYAVVICYLSLAGCLNEKSGEPGRKPADTTDMSINFSGKQIAAPIIYEVLVKNPDADDEWGSEKLENLKTEVLIEAVFSAVYSKKADAFNYHTDEKMSIEDIKYLESQEDFKRQNIGKIQFEEDWYFDTKNLIMGKKVHSILLAYEVYDSFNQVIGYKAGFVVHLN